MNRVVDWCRHSTHKLWVSLEQESVPTPLAGLPWSGTQYSQFSSPHPLIKPNLLELRRYYWITEMSRFPSPLTPNIGCLDCLLGFSDKAFQLQPDLNLSFYPSWPHWVGQAISLISHPNSPALGKWKILQSVPLRPCLFPQDSPLRLKTSVWETSPYWNLYPSRMAFYLQAPSNTIHCIWVMGNIS